MQKENSTRSKPHVNSARSGTRSCKTTLTAAITRVLGRTTPSEVPQLRFDRQRAGEKARGIRSGGVTSSSKTPQRTATWIVPACRLPRHDHRRGAVDGAILVVAADRRADAANA